MIQWYLKVVKENYANFNGRARRAEYWNFVLVNVIISIVLSIIDMFLSKLIGFNLLSTLYSLAVLVPSIAVGVRRMHDVGKAWWYILIPIYDLILAVTEGDKGSNEYGPDPKANA